MATTATRTSFTTLGKGFGGKIGNVVERMIAVGAIDRKVAEAVEEREAGFQLLTSGRGPVGSGSAAAFYNLVHDKTAVTPTHATK